MVEPASKAQLCLLIPRFPTCFPEQPAQMLLSTNEAFLCTNSGVAEASAQPVENFAGAGELYAMEVGEVLQVNSSSSPGMVKWL